MEARGHELKGLFLEAGVNLGQTADHIMRQRVTAACVLFGARLLGKKDVTLYDGSWSCWGSDPATPKAIGKAMSEPGGDKPDTPETRLAHLGSGREWTSIPGQRGGVVNPLFAWRASTILYDDVAHLRSACAAICTALVLCRKGYANALGASGCVDRAEPGAAGTMLTLRCRSDNQYPDGAAETRRPAADGRQCLIQPAAFATRC